MKKATIFALGVLLGTLAFGFSANAQSIPSQQPFWVSGSYITPTPLNTSLGLKIPSLSNQNCLGTDSTGVFGPGTCSGGGGGSTFGTSSLSALLPLVYTQSSSLAQFSTLFSTTSTWGIGNNGFLITSATGVPFVAASSTLNLPNTALQNSSVTVNGTTIALGASGTVTANTTNALTFNNSGSGAVSGTIFNGGTAQTISYNTIGAQVAGNYITALTGDGTASGPGSVALTLATVNSNVGTFTYPSVTVNGKGLITAISNGTAPTTYSAAFPVTLTGSVFSSAFSTTSNSGMAQGNLYVGSGGIFQTSATGTISNGAGISVTAGQSVIGSGLTITNTGVTSLVAGTGISVSGSTGAVTITNTVSAGAAYPFTPSTFGIAVSATTTPILDYPGLIAATSTIGALTASSSITNQSVKSALVLNSSTGLEGAYGGSTNPCAANQAPTTLSAVGALGGCTSTFLTTAVTSVGLSDSNSTLTIGSTPVTTTGTITATLNLAHSNIWSVLQTFNGAPNSAIFGNNVGIGTTTPAPTYQTEIASSTGQQLVLSDATTADNQWAFRNAGGTLYIGTSSPTTYATSSTQSAIQVTSSATTLFGIATSTPWRTLSVTGTVGFSGLSSAAGVQVGYLCLSSNQEVINDSVACLVSSERYKNDIDDLSAQDSLIETLALQPVSFEYKADFNGDLESDPNYNGPQVGFIAEDVQKIDPRLVTVDTATSTFEGKTYGPGTPSSVRYQNLTAVLVGAIQEQQKEIGALKVSMTKTTTNIEETWQWLAIVLLFAGLVYQGWQIIKMKQKEG